MHACKICRQDSSLVFVCVLGLHVEGNRLSASNEKWTVCRQQRMPSQKKENCPNLSIFIRFNFSVRKNCKKHKDNLTGHVLHLNIFCRILSGILIKNMNLSGFCVVVKTIIHLSSPFFLVPAIHRQKKIKRRKNGILPDWNLACKILRHVL